MRQVFISHIEEEQDIAEEIARGLEDAGYSVWYYERDSYPGADYLDQVSSAIESCDVVLVLISPNSITSRQIEDEVKWAREIRKSFVPVLHHMSWTEFQERPIKWRMALGIAAGITIPQGGVPAILPRVLKGLENLGVRSVPPVGSENGKAAKREPPISTAAKPGGPIHVSQGEKPTTRQAVVEEDADNLVLRETRTLHHTSSVLGVAIGGDGRVAISACADNSLKVWEMDSWRELRTLLGHTAAVNDVSLSGDGRLAVSASDDKSLMVWDVASGRALRTLTGHTNGVRAAAVTADGQHAISASWDETLKVWDVASGRELRTLVGHSAVVWGVALSGDGRLAISSSSDETLKVWDVASGRALRTLLGHSHYVSGVALSEDGWLAVSASFDKTLKVWDVASGRELRTLHGHTDEVYGVVLSGDGRLAVSASADQTLKVWGTANGRESASLAAGAVLGCCAISPDGKTILAGDAQGGIHVIRLG